ncbi:MAG: rfbB, partial [Propionibacteriaceae bacterium]|nr:rfbB [Propionibacteriaceae bacterium]
YADFEDGLAQTIDWYRRNVAWWRPQKAATEAAYARQGQ